MNTFIPKLFIVVGFVFLFSGCHICNKSTTIQTTPDYTYETNQLRQLVIKCGIPEAQAAKMPLKDLVTELKIKFNDAYVYSGAFFSPDDLKKTQRKMYGETRFLDILNDYDQFIKKLEDKQIIILPHN